MSLGILDWSQTHGIKPTAPKEGRSSWQLGSLFGPNARWWKGIKKTAAAGYLEMEARETFVEPQAFGVVFGFNRHGFQALWLDK